MNPLKRNPPKTRILLTIRPISLTSKRWKIFLWLFIAFNTITSLLDAAIIFPQCTPVQLNWDHSVEGHCWSPHAINATGIAQGIIAALTDFTLSLLPIVFLWKIKIHLRIKVGICGLMALGFASGAFAVARTVLVPSLTTTKDPTWDLVDLFLWATLEATLGVIAAAAPSVRPLFGHNDHSTTYIHGGGGSNPFHRSGTSKGGDTSHSTWFGGASSSGAADAELGDLQNLKDAGATPANGVEANRGRKSDLESSAEDRLWAGYTGRIVKTTEVDVSLTKNGLPTDLSRESTEPGEVPSVGGDGVSAVSPPESEGDIHERFPQLQEQPKGLAI